MVTGQMLWDLFVMLLGVVLCAAFLIGLKVGEQ